MYNILICDDEKDIVSALKIYLKTSGYNIYEAYNGKEALEQIKEHDIHFGVNGYHDAGDGWDHSDVKDPRGDESAGYPSDRKE